MTSFLPLICSKQGGILVQHLFFSPYKMQNKGQQKTRQGALLKFLFVNGVGHADLHPYVEKGEENLKFYLTALEQKNFKPLICQQALSIAWIEAQAQGLNLLSALNVPLSHYLITNLENFNALDSVLACGFRVFKVKLKKPLNQQTKKLLDLIKAGGVSVKWRLDFPHFLRKKEWQEWTQESLKCLPQENIDFIEAPFHYKEKGLFKPVFKGKPENKLLSFSPAEAQESPHIKNLFGADYIRGYPLAWDVWSGETTLPVYALVFKSSRKNLDTLFKKYGLFQRVIFTHTLAHPLDQITSAYFASSFYKVLPHLREVCGLVQTNIYEKSAWTLPYHGPLFPKFSGPGWGFSHLLDRLSWKKLF